MNESNTDARRLLYRVKELEWRAELARLVLAGDTAALAERLAQGPAVSSFATSTDEAFLGYLDELERLCNAATPGPWTFDFCEGCVNGGDKELIANIPDMESAIARCDGMFIEAARHGLPKVIAKVRELQARFDGYALEDEHPQDDSGAP